ncbi:thioesterase II family protein [Xenorhabdus thuongxuanensis]|uniref:Pyochelin biosynthetic protein PchC n=1 Tax=Xenorhabdus thuongxuanensis TaxID=1873484 RepID=A0A1Q5TWU9_9GAMM|nr:thioesterase domain-containing protein [Xenorhabdus thuongxuanensis]OKP04686.1 pyochelin biosynthetic protein PchC [Xenorhabdus thuongxuanensis]
MKNFETRNEGAVRLSMTSTAPVRHQLVIFPHAGGSVDFYRSWRDCLPPDVDLIVMQYPQVPQDETITDWHDPLAAIRRCTRSLSSLLGIAPVTLFGHSMGALLALHVASAMAESRFRIEQLIVSSQHTPSSLQGLLKTDNDVDCLKDRALVLGEVAGMNTLDDSTQNFLGMLIRQDLVLLRQLAVLPVGELPTTRIFGGEEDPMIGLSNLKEWSCFLSRNTAPETFPGGHFYFCDQVQSVLDAILRQGRMNPTSSTTNTDM